MQHRVFLGTDESQVILISAREIINVHLKRPPSMEFIAPVLDKISSPHIHQRDELNCLRLRKGVESIEQRLPWL